MPLIDAHRLKKEQGSDSLEGLRINSAGVFFAIYFATYSTVWSILFVNRLVQGEEEVSTNTFCMG